jgi:hypothetical protein
MLAVILLNNLHRRSHIPSHIEHPNALRNDCMA